jgi:hypothetical protein
VIKEHFLSLSDASLWNELLPASRSVFGSLGYAKVCAEHRHVVPRLFVLQNGSARIQYPMLLRPLEELPFAGSDSLWRWDSTTPEFTGPDTTSTSGELLRWFERTRDATFQREGIVAEFAHLHPWADWPALIPGGCVRDREIVWVDTRIPPREMWHEQFEHCCRKNINMAYRNSVSVFTGDSDEHLEEFFRIYTGTMTRNQAQPGYFFPLAFFRSLRDQLRENCRFTFAAHQGRTIAATLYLYDDRDVYSYLGGADVEHQRLRPTNAVIWETILWAHETGKLRLILGGGHKPGDGIFRFKKTFSKKLKPFHVYKRIHGAAKYEQLEQSCRLFFKLDLKQIPYFPSYRYASPANQQDGAGSEERIVRSAEYTADDNNALQASRSSDESMYRAQGC